MITIRNRRWIGVLLITGLIGSIAATCNGYRTAVVTATNLDNQFATTGAAMDTLVRGQKITWDQYEPWRQFANRYKPLSASAYTALKAGKDPVTTQQAVTIINTLESEIAMWLIFSQGK